MSPAMVRAGGIMALVMIPVVLVLGLLIGMAALAAFFNPGAGTVWSLIALLYFVFLAFAVFVFWTTRGLFDAFGHAAADGPILLLIVLLVLGPPLVLLPWTWFSILAARFGRQVGSRLWQATGVIYLIAMALIAAAVAPEAFGEYALLDLVGFALAMLLIGWGCHGIGLIVWARKIVRT